MYFLNQRLLITILCIISVLNALAFNSNIKAVPVINEQTLHIAVASNFTTTLKKLVLKYSENHTVKIIISSASTGKITTQIRHGAPFDLFLAADSTHPKLLITENLADQRSFYAYAKGLLALISHKGKAKSAKAALQSGDIKLLAVANEKTAPYGSAAQNWLLQAGFSKHSFQYIKGENVNQAWQFFKNGGADAALVAVSQIILAKNNNLDYWIVSDKSQHQIIQALVLIKESKNHIIAKDFIQFMKSSQAKKIIQQAGYLTY